MLTSLLLPAVIVYTLRKALTSKDWRYFWQRLGWRYPHLDSNPVWLHCASVGEVRAAAPLVKRLQHRHPNLPIVLTTGTTTGAELTKKIFGESLRHIYLPFDGRIMVKRFFKAIKPRAALILETEIWPTLFAKCSRANIPLVIVNGRLSHKTSNPPKWIKTLYLTAMQNVSAVLARSEEDAKKFVYLGMHESRVKNLGNIKFSALEFRHDIRPERLLPRPYWLAASTHGDEEQQLARIAIHNADRWPLLVIAPRHPDRSRDIQKQLSALNINYAVRSEEENITSKTQVYLADTLGELEDFMTHAEVVFMGGSLVPVGGHNLLEPASLGKAIISGPHLYNFEKETLLLTQHKALLVVNNTTELQACLDDLLTMPDKRTTLGENARTAVSNQSAIADEYLEALEAMITLN